MKIIILALFITVIFTSCKTLKEADYTPALSQETFLPSLKAEYDIDNLYIVYAYGKSGSAENSKKIMNSKLIYYDLIQQSKPYVNDIIKTYKNEISQIIHTSSSPIGSIKLSIHNYKNNHSGGQIFAVIYFQLWLLGVPITPVNVNLDIELVILNNSGEIIKSNNAKGFGRSIAGMYWNYGLTGARRKANLLAFQKAMESIKNDLKNDSVYLYKILLPYK